MTEPLLHRVLCTSPQGIHRTAFWEWPCEQSGPRPVLFCAHGLTRNGRDFDLIAQRLRKHYRVIAVDYVGRGQSDRLADAAGYAVPQYLADSLTVIARLGAEQVTWLGTSMGGIVGMVLAGMPNNPIETLVLNDIGPQIAAEGLQRISTMVGRAPQLTGYDQAKAIVVTNSATFGPHSEAHWDLFVKHYVVQRAGEWVFNYDAAIAHGTRQSQREPINLWPYYDQIKVQTLLIRGATSDLLSADIALQMTQRGPKAQLVEFAGVGHAPTLLPSDQIDAVENFLLKATV
jgi:pimeloyl-ACP methyl ester carboxylesterase